MNSLRVLFIGGLTSYRALFNWISPWVFVPQVLGYPIFEILFFAYLGRYAGVQSDQFFLIGNAFLAIAVTGMFGMGHAVAGERRSQTLASLLASPANRFALFLGRALPSIVTGVVVAATSFAICSLILGGAHARVCAGGHRDMRARGLVRLYRSRPVSRRARAAWAQRESVRRLDRRLHAARLGRQRPAASAPGLDPGDQLGHSPHARDPGGA